MASTEWILEFVDRTGLDSLGHSLDRWGPQDLSRDPRGDMIVYEVLQSVGLIMNDGVSLCPRAAKGGVNSFLYIAKASGWKCSIPVSTESDISHRRHDTLV